MQPKDKKDLRIVQCLIKLDGPNKSILSKFVF